MRCPFPLQPHQIRGLDYNSIHPIVKWLLEFVEETREERKDTNQFISSEIGDRLIYKKRNYFELPCVPKAKILSKNTKIENYGIDDPIRIYSCLAEMGDEKAAGIYQKMILKRIADAEKGDKKPKLKKEKSEIKPILFDFKDMQQAPVKKEKKVVIEKVVAVAPDQIEEFATKTRMKRSGSIDQDEFMKILEENQEDNEDLVEKLKDIETEEKGTVGSELQKEKAIFEEQKNQLEEELRRAEAKLEEVEEELQEISKEEKTSKKSYNEVKQKNDDLKEALENIEKQIE